MYTAFMKTRKTDFILDRLIDPLSECLTPESARRILKLKADERLQARLDKLGELCTAGRLTPEEHAEYQSYVSFGTFIAILKSKARVLLAKSNGV